MGLSHPDAGGTRTIVLVTRPEDMAFHIAGGKGERFAQLLGMADGKVRRGVLLEKPFTNIPLRAFPAFLLFSVKAFIPMTVLYLEIGFHQSTRSF